MVYCGSGYADVPLRLHHQTCAYKDPCRNMSLESLTLAPATKMSPNSRKKHFTFVTRWFWNSAGTGMPWVCNIIDFLNRWGCSWDSILSRGLLKQVNMTTGFPFLPTTRLGRFVISFWTNSTLSFHGLLRFEGWGWARAKGQYIRVSWVRVYMYVRTCGELSRCHSSFSCLHMYLNFPTTYMYRSSLPLTQATTRVYYISLSVQHPTH